MPLPAPGLLLQQYQEDHLVVVERSREVVRYTRVPRQPVVASVPAPPTPPTNAAGSVPSPRPAAAEANEDHDVVMAVPMDLTD